MLFLCYGFGCTGFVMGLLAFTPFIASWSGWVWRMRLLTASLEFGAILAAVTLFVLLPRLVGRRFSIGAWLMVLAAALAAQLLWLPIQSAYRQTEVVWRADLASGRYIADLYRQPLHRWGRLNIPADQPTLTYVLAHAGGVAGSDIVGQLYDPFYDLPSGYRYADHRPEATRLMACWLKNTNTSIFVLPISNANYVAFLSDRPDLLTEIGSLRQREWLIESVRSREAVASVCAG
jgi:hypothetical protein